MRALRRRRLPVRFGDAEDPGFLETLPLAQLRWVVSTLPSWEANRALLHALQTAGYAGAVAAAARDAAHGQALKAAGVARILNPFDDAADHAARNLAVDLRASENPSTTIAETSP